MTTAHSSGGERPEHDDGDAGRIRTAALACAGVAELSAGPLGEIASYLPGRTVQGVRIDDEHVEVHIVAAWGHPLRGVADDVGRAVAPMLAGRPLTLVVDDIRLPDEDAPDGHVAEPAPTDPAER